MAERFYVNCPLEPGRTVRIEGNEAHHLLRVCRLRPGAPVCLFNGDGSEYPALVREAARQAAVLEVLGVASPCRELGIRLEIAAPLPKGDRAQFLIEKLTELGATHFTPLRTARSVVHPGGGKREKLERYVIEASKQCGRNTLLIIEPLCQWESYCRRHDLPAARWLADPAGQERMTARRQDTVLAVGPEGGLTPEEIDSASHNGWQLVALGPTILRVETAALVLAARARAWDSGT
jgi:16S rRNA (uracil1498-N3)-methyltransferase